MYCVRCQAESGATLFCHICDNYLPKPDTGVKAGLVSRFFAVVLDNLLVIIVFLLTVISAVKATQTWPMLAALAALLLYSIAFIGCLTQGVTPGKALLSVRVVDKRTGLAATFGRMFVREIIGKIVSGFFFGLGFFWAIWDRDGQAWHDKLAGTVVIKNEDGITSEMRTTPWPGVAFAMLASALIFAAIGLKSPEDRADISSINSPQASSLPSAEENVDAGSVQEDTSTQLSTNNSSEVGGTSGDAGQPTSASAPNEEENTSSRSAGISAFLDQWAAAMQENDAAKMASFYAEHVDRYFLARNVTREFIENDKEKWLGAGHRFVSYKLDDVVVQSDMSGLTTVSLTKNTEWSDTGAAPISRQTHARLWLSKDQYGWHIVGEQDLLR